MTENGRAFNEWLRAQLKAKKMSQRQLAQQSGVDHSTISRLIRGDRMPSLGTATKLARGLREIRDDSDTSTALGVVSMGPQNPTARVEYALRADEALSEPQVRQIMEYYLAVRVRRFARTYTSVGATEQGLNGNGSMSSAGSVYGRPGDRHAGGHRAIGPGPPAALRRPAAAAPAPDPNAGSSIDFSRARPERPSTLGSRGQRTPVCRGRRSHFRYGAETPLRRPPGRPRSRGGRRRRTGRVSVEPGAFATIHASSAGPPHAAPTTSSNSGSHTITIGART